MVLFTLCKIYIFSFSSFTLLTLEQLLQLYCRSFIVHQCKQVMLFTAAICIRVKKSGLSFSKTYKSSHRAVYNGLSSLTFLRYVGRFPDTWKRVQITWVFSIIKHSHWYKSWKCAYQLFIVRLQPNSSLWIKFH